MNGLNAGTDNINMHSSLGVGVISLLVAWLTAGVGTTERVVGENGEVYVPPPPQLSRQLQRKFPHAKKLHPALLPRKHQAALVHSFSSLSPLVSSAASKENRDSVELDRTLEEEHFLPQHDPHVAKLLNVDVRCSRESLDVLMTFDSPFHGVIYSKGHYSDPQCRYQHQPLSDPVNASPNSAEQVVSPDSATQMRFTVYPDRCGSRLVEGPQNGETYIENTVVVQNTPGIQSVVDTARALRCVFEPRSGPGSVLSRTVSSSLSVDVLDVISVTYSGDSIDSYLDVQLGKGPFHASPVNGLVKIGETLTLVVYIHGDDYDVRVKDCMAHDGNAANSIRLSNDRGCVSAPKLMGPWQKTRETGNTGASAIAWAYLEAFKFPDKLEVFIECNIEICKFQCQHDPHECLVGRKKKFSSRKKRAVLDGRIASNSSSVESPTLPRIASKTLDDGAGTDASFVTDAQEHGDVTDTLLNDQEQEQLAERAHLMRGIRVVAPEDSIDASAVPVRSSTFVAVGGGTSDRPGGLRARPAGGTHHLVPHLQHFLQHNQLCVSTTGFLFVAGLSVAVLVALLLTIVGLYLRMRQLDPDVQLVSEAAMVGSLQRRHVIASISERAGQGAPRRKGDF
ncbi:uncharacterized protein LOC111272092 isoform X2 [Varroa jacobsoni]|uniref:uncharacterized protein LOC111272092 isoform X2 n=1 Tax=Varroa jacobsoni TaxID=62625 RepID=UPI000BF3F5F3|nr:uncharacterized protein LOC111272092 isoform X2 [Varroa jacobsoni]